MTQSSGRQPPPYERIVASIAARITSGELEPGARVPSTREITREWGVAMATASKALAALRRDGLVDAVRGVGTVVSAAPAPGPPGTREDRPGTRGATSTTGATSTRGAASARGRRGRPEAALTRETIVRAAISVVDDDGIDDFSMRRVAEELRVSTMALYRHVADRTDLVSAMLETIYRDAEFPELPAGNWRAALEMSMRWSWAIHRDHPWVLRLIATAGPFITPAVMAATERMMDVIMAEGCPPDAALETVTVLHSFVDGLAVQGLLVETADPVIEEAGQWWQARAPELAHPADRSGFPRVISVSRPPDVESIFTMGMERLLDGLAPVITAGR